MARKFLSLVLATTLVATLVIAIAAPSAFSSPVATDGNQYLALGRIFPDPHGCNAAGSPFAKGNVCAADFIQFAEMQAGLDFLEETFPNFVKVYTLSEDFNCKGKPVNNPEKGCRDFRSAGLPVTADAGGQTPSTFSRQRLPLKMVRITDERLPNKNKKYFVFPLSIHGIERAGVEGGTRAAEDLATWGACETDEVPNYVDCAAEGDMPHPLLEATPEKSVSAGDALAKAAVFFIYPNPDGWNRGERTTGAQSFQRYNGNGVDLNRDWPTKGFTFRPYTPWSEPESRAFGKALQGVGPKDAAGNPNWFGGIDLHGQLVDRAFSFTLMGASERPFDKNQRILQVAKGAWKDAEARLAWSPLIKPNDAPADDPRLYGVQWGTVWDTIAYTVTGSLGDWIDSPIGLGADGIDNEMSLSHLSNCGTGSCFDQDVEQLHVDGNKSLVYSMINFSLLPENQTLRTKGRVAYLHNKGFISAPTKKQTTPPKYTKYPTQDSIVDEQLDETNDYIFEFDVDGPKKGVYNGGMAAEITCANAQGVGPCALDEAVLERKNPREGEEEWETVNTYFNQSSIYVQAGQALHANYPSPGRYRVRIDTSAPSFFNLAIHFSKEKAWEDPGQLGYKVSTMNFWKMLKRYAKPGISKLTPREVATTNRWKRRYDTIVVTNRVYPKLAGKLRRWVGQQNGNLVLLDGAMLMLTKMGIKIDKAAVGSSKHYAGYVNFATQKKETTYGDPLTKGIDAPGAAEGSGGGESRRHQTYEPVPIGISIQSDNGNDFSNSPVWWIQHSALQGSLGKHRTAGSTGDGLHDSLGEIKLFGGRIRFLGALLPDPSTEFDHTFGLSNYSLTYSGYELVRNLLTWKRP